MDWLDIVLHVLVAAAIVLAAAFLGWQWYLAPLVALAFFARESWQDHAKRRLWRSPLVWSAQKLAEAIAPSIAAVAMAAVAGRLVGLLRSLFS